MDSSSRPAPLTPGFFANPAHTGHLILGVALVMMGSIILGLFRVYCCPKVPYKPGRGEGDESEEQELLELASPDHLHDDDQHGHRHHYGAIRPAHSCCTHAP